MRTNFSKTTLAVFFLLGLGRHAAADDFVIDAAHSGVTFKIKHLDLSYVHGRFDKFSGSFTLDSSDPAKSSFKMNIRSDSIDTNNAGRDNHLRGPDFFNAKQFPAITFTSTSVKPIEGGYEVTGDLTLHGETKPITFSLKGGRTAQFQGAPRTGFSTELMLKRSEFRIVKFPEMLGDEVYVSIGFEGAKKR
ncbi:MAG: YceI family protein [Isosphaerales bacterium]